MSGNSYFDAWSTKDELNQDLANANNFTQADLQINRSGRIADSQMWWLALRAFKPFSAGLAAFAGWMLFLIVLDVVVPGWLPWLLSPLIFAKYGMIAATQALSIGLAASFSAIAAFLVGLFRTTRLTFLLIQDLASGTVASMEGRASPSWEERPAPGFARLFGSKEAVHYFVVRDEKFEVGSGAHELLQNKFSYYAAMVRIYYTPKSKLLLSAEAL